MSEQEKARSLEEIVEDLALHCLINGCPGDIQILLPKKVLEALSLSHKPIKRCPIDDGIYPTIISTWVSKGTVNLFDNEEYKVSKRDKV